MTNRGLLLILRFFWPRILSYMVTAVNPYNSPTPTLVEHF